jgi:integrase
MRRLKSRYRSIDVLRAGHPRYRPTDGTPAAAAAANCALGNRQLSKSLNCRLPGTQTSPERSELRNVVNAAGQREYAILLLLARLGLRAAEVGALSLEDLDWDHGEIVVICVRIIVSQASPPRSALRSNHTFAATGFLGEICPNGSRGVICAVPSIPQSARLK